MTLARSAVRTSTSALLWGIGTIKANLPVLFSRYGYGLRSLLDQLSRQAGPIAQ